MCKLIYKYIHVSNDIHHPVRSTPVYTNPRTHAHVHTNTYAHTVGTDQILQQHLIARTTP